MFEIKAISITPAANDESIQFAEWLCSVELDDALTIFIDGTSSHDVRKGDWHGEATIRYPVDAKLCDTQLMDLVGSTVEVECALRVGTEIQTRLRDGDISLMAKRV